MPAPDPKEVEAVARELRHATTLDGYARIAIAYADRRVREALEGAAHEPACECPMCLRMNAYKTEAHEPTEVRGMTLAGARALMHAEIEHGRDEVTGEPHYPKMALACYRAMERARTEGK